MDYGEWTPQVWGRRLCGAPKGGSNCWDTKKAAQLVCLVLCIGLVVCQPSKADRVNLLDLSLEELMNLDFSTEEAQEGITIYGYMSANIEKVFGELSVVDNQTVKTDVPHKWSTPHFHLFLRATPGNDIETLVNLSSEELDVVNMWGSIKVHEGFQLKVGKIYRPFGLFNEKLDEVPAYLGIEPPELFDGDHLILPRLTAFVVHGDFAREYSTFSYSLCTDNGENGPAESVIPLGWDLRVKIHNKAIFGTSGYVSNLGSTSVTPSEGVGDGSPSGGVLPWMAADDYTVVGGFAEVQVKNLLIKAAYWQANHTFVRDPELVLSVANSTDLNQHQGENFFGENADLATASLTESDVLVNGNYKVQTWYLRLGYSFYTDRGTFAPFAFLDWMNNEETIAETTYGGDSESGVADDGKFYKYTIGMSYKPVDKVAIKLDHSSHIQKYNGKTESYPEVRLDISYLFK